MSLSAVFLFVQFKKKEFQSITLFCLSYAGFIRSGKVRKESMFLRVVRKSQEKSGKVMKCQEILLKLEESQEKVRKFYQLSEFCGDQL